MLKLDFRIGTKLGISADVGVLLVDGMVVNTMMSGDPALQLAAKTAASPAIKISLL